MTTRYHFVLTLQLPTHVGVEMRSWSSTVDVPPGTGRHALYTEVLAQLTADDPRWARATVLHWSLDRDELPHGALAPTPAGAGDVPRQRG
ncbi:hypothetical protein [Streptomyces sp. NPDC008121]|uniref:hypothetical protein n=1 Tax=Streptomyces sp. NPDC008121 TaxID=3364809 RepID=UPI0036EB58C5